MIQLIIILAVNGFINTVSAQVDELRAFPREIVFNAVQGHPVKDTRSIFIFTTLGSTINWSQSADVSWLTLEFQDGVTEGIAEIGVNISAMEAGLYQGNITIESAQVFSGTVRIAVTLIINPDVPVGITTWKDDRDAAMSVSIDDGQPSGFDELQKNGFAGTYVTNGISPPSFYPDYYKAGMELGAHLVSHPCYFVSDDVLRSQEIQPNISGICTDTPVPCEDVITLVWPCGVTNYHEQAVASDFFLSGRGYNINRLEDATPVNFMNLKSYNSHEHAPYPPQDLKTLVDSAIIQNKWFNLVLHSMNNDDGAINYASSKNIWVNTIGAVIKYILQRDRFILSDYTESEEKITYRVSRLSIPSSVSKNFEMAFTEKDLTTMQIDINDNKIVEYVLVNGETKSFQIITSGGNKVILANVKLEASTDKTIEIKFLKSNKLLQNYPNPFNTFTWTEFYLDEDSRVTLDIFNAAGQKIETILNKYMRSGSYKFKWESRNFASGNYYLSLRTEKFTDTIKMSLIK